MPWRQQVQRTLGDGRVSWKIVASPSVMPAANSRVAIFSGFLHTDPG
jgi:hypothetical protein